ncbi:hypothetical protein CRUP_032910 [Coryphaenoides rupestris]|nr:hypothetical protein CRUP_032910 [Coryphaenoides rupestris]
MKCDRCRQCAGALVFVKNCNGTADTVCGCPAGQRCGDSGCTYCVKGSANANTSPPTTMKTTTPRPMPVAEDNMLSWWLFILFVICCVLLITLMLFIKIIKKLKEKKTKRKEPARITKKSPIIATPTESVATEDSEVSEASDGSTEKLIV